MKALISAVFLFFGVSQMASAVTICTSISGCSANAVSGSHSINTNIGGSVPVIVGGISILNNGNTVIIKGSNGNAGKPAAQVSSSGDLYLDYSLFSTNKTVSPKYSVTFNAANALSVELPNGINAKALPANAIFHSLSDSAQLVLGNNSVLMSTNKPLQSAVNFSANNIYIGDYSDFTQVPVPAAAYLFLSAFVLLFKRVAKKQ